MTLPWCCQNTNTLLYIYSHIIMLQLYNIFLCRPNKYLPCDRKRDIQHYAWKQKDTYLSNMETQFMQSQLFTKLISLLLPCISGPEMLTNDALLTLHQATLASKCLTTHDENMYPHPHLILHIFLAIVIIIIITGIQPLGRSGQRPELSQVTGMSLVHCILGNCYI